MAAYTRQSSFSDGDTINASLFNNEYDAIAATFVNTSGHKHDGTTGEGPVIGLIGDASVATPLNKVLIDSSNNHIEFYVDVSSAAVQQMHLEDGKLLPNVDSDIDLGSSSKYFANAYIDAITTTGNVTVGGNLTVTGTTTFNGGTINLGDAATDNVAFNGTITTNLIFEGSTSDAHETTLAPGNPGSDITLTLPSSATDTLVGRATTDTLTNKTLTSPKINEDVVVTSTATELNLLDGVTATTSELNILDGVTSTASELNTLDGITAVVGELNALDLGSTAIGTAIASKAVILDSNKDYTDIRNLTITGELDGASLDIEGDADINGTLEADAITIGGTAINTVIAGVTVTNATNAAHVSVADNENTNEENLIPFIEDASATGNVGLESDGDFAYNPSTGTVTASIFKGNVDAVDGDFDGTLEADAITIAGTALDTHIAGVTVTNATTAVTATNANHISVADNENTNENNLITFIEDASATGNVGLESDGDFYYNPSTGTVTATGFAGALTGNASTATALATSRTIHGVSFDGSANIDLTEVIQDTVGAMFTGNTETDITATYQDADGTIDLVVGGTTIGGGTGVDFNDNVKARFGTGNDLEVYHDGSNGYITNSDGALKLATETSGIAVTIGHSTSEVTVADNLTVTGNLTVSGTTTTVNSTTVEVADAMLKLAKDQGTSADAVDFGFYGKYGVGGTAKYAGIFRDQSATGTPFTFFDTLEADPGTTVDTGGTGYDLADISAGGATFADDVTITGDLTVSGDDITMGTNTSGYIMVADGTNFNPVAVSGDVTISNSGAVTIASTAVETGMIAADAITGAKIADDAVDSEHYTDGSIDTAHLGDLQVTTGKIANDAITGAKIADDALDSEHYTDGSIDTAHIADDQVTQAKIADESVDEARLEISNAGSNGQYLQKQSGNAGGLTWADVSLAADDISTGDAAVTLATSAGNITIDAQGNDTDIIFKGTDGTVDTTFLTIDGSDAGTATFNHDVKLADNGKVVVGTGNDLEIYHDGSNGIIKQDSATGLEIMADEFRVQNSAGTETIIAGDADGAVSLYHNDTKKLETTSDGADISGTLGVISAKDLGIGIHIKESDSGSSSVDGHANQLVIEHGTSGEGCGMSFLAATDGFARIAFGDSGDDNIGQIVYNNTGNSMTFITNAANALVIDSSGNGTFTGNVTAYSDERLKSDIKTIDNALDKVSQMRGVSFTKDDKKGSGVIAQELEKIAPELVTDGEYKSVAYGNIVGYLIEAIKELKAEVKQLKESK